MEAITRLSYLTDVTIVTLTAQDAQREFITEYFESLSRNGVNVDMISQSVPMDRSIRISFTADDSDLPGVLQTTAGMRDACRDLLTELSSQNVKLTFFGQEMSTTPGIAGIILRFFLGQDISPKLISTSLYSITCLIDGHDFMRIRAQLEEVFGKITDKFV